MHTLSDAQSGSTEIDWHETDDRLLLWPEVRHQTGLSRTTAWRMERSREFPARVQLSPGRVGWWESEVTAWKMSRRLARLAGTARGRGRPRGSSGADPSPPVDRRPPAPAQPAIGPASGDRSDLTGEDPMAAGSAPLERGPVPIADKRRRRSARISPGQMGFDF